MTTEELVKHSLQNDKDSQRKLYNLLSPSIMRVCERYCSTNQMAQDSFQETFIIIFDKLSQWDVNRGNLEGWSYKIAVNTSLGQLRKEKKFLYEDDTHEEIEDKNLYLPINDNLEYKDLLHIVNELPSGQKAVFNLFAIEGYGHKEIADMLKITEGTSKSQLAKARVTLKNKYVAAYNLV